MREIVMRMRVGIAFTALVVAAAFAITAWTGPIYGLWDWPVVAAAVLILGAMAFAGITEALRPQNPYRNMNPMYGMLDAGPTGQLHSGGTGWIWNALPMMLTAVVLTVLF
jgi:hypothetical protein